MDRPGRESRGNVDRGVDRLVAQQVLERNAAVEASDKLGGIEAAGGLDLVSFGPQMRSVERQTLNASLLSDEARLPGLPNFTGAFVGMACYDLTGTRMPADFSRFRMPHPAVSDFFRRLTGDAPLVNSRACAAYAAAASGKLDERLASEMQK